MRVNTQWRVGFGGRDSLDYTAAWSTFDRLGLDVSVEDFDGITVMERAALNAWAAARS